VTNGYITIQQTFCLSSDDGYTMTLQQLRYLLGIADSGLNITAAAERLYTSQPGISKQLKLLEQELGIQLFTRKGKSLSAITPAGHEVIARARRILREVENIRSLASDLSEEQEGTLSIATTHTQARYVLPEVIKEFRRRYPKVSLELHQGTAEQIAELVVSNRVDFAIASGSHALFPELVLLPCYEWDRIVLVPVGHDLTKTKNKNKEPLSIERLSYHPLVTYVFSLTGESSFKKAFNDKELEPDVVFTARDADIIKTYVRMGMGVGVVAAMAWECQDKDDLVALDATGLFPRVTTWIGFRRDTVLRGYMVDFAALFAPHLAPELTQRAASFENQEDVDALLADVDLPLRGGCDDEFGSALPDSFVE
jgi:LysR family cys regulon transcriptional activator